MLEAGTGADAVLMKSLVALLCLFAAGACSPGPSATSPVTLAPSPSVVAAPSPTVVAEEPTESPTFESKVYPWAITLPAGLTTRRWHPATRQWNGTEPISSAAPFDDDNGTPDGSLFLLGTPTTLTVREFFMSVASNTSRFRGCSSPADVADVQLVGEPAIFFTQQCAEETFAARLVSVHQGFGVVAVVLGVPAAKRGTVQNDLVSWLRGFEWR
jgi:hypothetical protein